MSQLNEVYIITHASSTAETSQMFCSVFNLEKILSNFFKTEVAFIVSVEMFQASCSNSVILTRVL
jgi:hypothetical protein